MKNDANPMDPVQRLRNAPRRSATAKSTRRRCQSPAVRGWRVCRMHGAGGGAPPGKAHPNYKHGMRTKEWTGMRKLVNELVQDLDALK